jgi:diaminohydroxyphosphoribosylaminopyrimidine deaminase/5-amino-6-(5-phosphoribosylamino)uracil reductase
MTDTDWMAQALALAERGRGYVEPNPLVGAVVVRDGRLVGEGWHRRYGEAHAEINALAVAGEAARGATLYVTLEPCCHFGKTPPCTDAIIRAGITRVVAAMGDPFPRVAGKGAELLRQAGIAVEVGLCGGEAYWLNRAYAKLLGSGRPYVHAKWAMTLDGKIATRTGDSKWISNEASRRRVHELRGRMDAIVVGVGTVLADDPLLTARPPGPRWPVRVVLDHRGRTPTTSKLAQSAGEIPTWIVTDGEPAPQLAALGCTVLNLPNVDALLDEMGRRRMTNVLVEGGPEVLGSFFDATAIDEFHVFIAPRLAGGAGAKSPIGGRGVEFMKEALPLGGWEVEKIQEVEILQTDIYLHGWLEV